MTPRGGGEPSSLNRPPPLPPPLSPPSTSLVKRWCGAGSDQGWQGRWESLTRAPRLAPPVEISAPRPAPRATPPRSRRPGHSTAGPRPWLARPGSVTTALASESPDEVSQEKTATVHTRPQPRAPRRAAGPRPGLVTTTFATPADVTQETMATARIRVHSAGKQAGDDTVSERRGFGLCALALWPTLALCIASTPRRTGSGADSEIGSTVEVRSDAHDRFSYCG